MSPILTSEGQLAKLQIPTPRLRLVYPVKCRLVVCARSIHYDAVAAYTVDGDVADRVARPRWVATTDGYLLHALNR